MRIIKFSYLCEILRNKTLKQTSSGDLTSTLHLNRKDEFLFDYSDKDNIDWNDPLQHDKLLDNLKVWYGVDVDGERSKLSLTKALMKFPNEPVLIDDLFYQKSYDKLGLVIIKIDEKCSKEVIVPEYSQHIGAVGAALLVSGMGNRHE